MKKRALSVIAVASAAAIVLAGCTGGDGSGEADTTLTIALASAPVSLDPSKAATGFYINFVEPTYASLLNISPEGEIVAGLADEWGYVDDDNTEFQFSLRDGVKFADGTDITADAVVASLEYFAAGSGPSAPYLAGMTFAAVDESTVSITSPGANPVIANLLTPEFLAGAVISPAGLEDPEQLAADTYGAGAYVYDETESVSGDSYVFTPNENFYDQDAIRYESITIKVIPNANSQLQALQSGQIDLMQGNADTAAAAANDANLDIITSPSLWAGLFLLDRDGTLVPALADVRVRQAINFAVDRDAITQAVYGEYGNPVAQSTVPGADGYSEAAEDFYSYDPEKAKELLADAGYADGFTIPVHYGSFDAENTKLVQAVQAQLAEVGITLELKSASNFGEWVEDIVSKQFAATVLSPGSGGKEFFVAQSTFLPGGIMNIFGSTTPEMLEAYDALTVAPEGDNTAAQKVSEVAVEQGFALPITAVDTIVIYNTKLQGVQFGPGGLPPFVTAWTSK